MTYDRAYLKEGAKSAMRGYKPSPIGVAAVYLVITLVLNFLTLGVNHFYANYSEIFNAALYGYDPIFRTPTSSDQILVFLIGIVGAMLGIGFSIFCMHVSRRQTGGFEDIFSAFPKFFRYLGLIFVVGIFVFLWTLLLIVPGIIAAYRYRLALYLAIDHPDWSVMQCIGESKRLMNGHKGKAFVLELSFIGWGILTGLTWGILGIWTTPYIEVTNVRFYEYVLAANGVGYPPPENPADRPDDSGNAENFWN